MFVRKEALSRVVNTLESMQAGDTFVVLTDAPYTKDHQLDDVFIKVDFRHYQNNGHSMVNLRTGGMHSWSGKLRVQKVTVLADVQPED